MIDILYEMYDSLVQALSAKYGAGKVGSSTTYTNTPSSYPFVSLVEIDNSVYDKGRDSCEIENFSNIAFEINCYTKGTTSLIDCRELLSVCDNFMKSKGFERISSVPMPTQNETEYRIVARYNAIVGKDHKTYRR